VRSSEGLEVWVGNDRRVRDESHLDDMRAAVRGDFERLAERRGTQELMRTPAAEPEQELANEPRPEEGSVAEEPSRRSWLARLFGR